MGIAPSFFLRPMAPSVNKILERVSHRVVASRSLETPAPVVAQLAGRRPAH